MAIYLGIDTSSSFLCLGLWSEQGLEERLELEVERDHTKRILSDLDVFLSTHSVAKKDLAGIAVGTGPGSYTGIRVGIATAKGLAKGLNIPLVGCSSLEAMAQRCLNEEQTAIVAIDARRDNVYYGIFKKQSEQLRLQSSLAKESRIVLKEQHPDLAWFESIVPDAPYLAKKAQQSEQVTIDAIYL